MHPAFKLVKWKYLIYIYSRFFLNEGEGGSHFKYFNMKILLTLITLCGGFLSLLTYVWFVVPGVAVSSSLWGKKIQFSPHPCLWQLRSGTVVPALKEFSVCMRLRLNYATDWTGFVYKAPQKRHIELGLRGTSGHLAVWLFGEEQHFERELKMHEWHSVCLTWSGQAQRLRLYINGTSHNETSVNPLLPQQLAQNGTLTLGVSHYIDPYGNLKAESGNNLFGEISLFRMWAREQSAEEVRGQSCADGDVVSWDMKEWSSGCPPVPDNNTYCGKYRRTRFCCISPSLK